MAEGRRYLARTDVTDGAVFSRAARAEVDATIRSAPKATPASGAPTRTTILSIRRSFIRRSLSWKGGAATLAARRRTEGVLDP